VSECRSINTLTFRHKIVKLTDFLCCGTSGLELTGGIAAWDTVAEGDPFAEDDRAQRSASSLHGLDCFIYDPRTDRGGIQDNGCRFFGEIAQVQSCRDCFQIKLRRAARHEDDVAGLGCLESGLVGVRRGIEDHQLDGTASPSARVVKSG
jgi:hypothetical protein